jgi:hypothetical protein
MQAAHIPPLRTKTPNPFLDLPEVLEAATDAASKTDMATASTPDNLDAVLATVLELEHRRTRKFDATMTALHGRNT